jgi:2-C-methyl-D-erythritol 4-phosphate cytidylyltransferase
MILNILVPLAGDRVFKMGEGSTYPKILSEVNGKLLLERAATPLLELEFEKSVVTVVLRQQVKQYNLDKVLESLDCSIKLVQIDGETKGATCTALMAINELKLDQPLIISSFEQVLDFHLSSYIQEFIS